MIGYQIIVSLLVLVNWFITGMYIRGAKLKDPQLQQLLQQLFGTVMSSKAPSTEKKYLYAFGHWKR